MNISYTGKYEALPPKQRAKLEAKLQKLSKMLERRGEKEMHVILTQERFLHKVEITVNAWDHAMVGIGSGPDPVIAANDAADKLEKQLLKLRAKWRDTKRVKDKEAEAGQGAAIASQPAQGKKTKNVGPPRSAAPVGKTAARKKVFRVNHTDGSKPMTLEEAMLEMEESQDYLVYRDARTDRVTVLMRRADGHFDLIES
ncbi:MAG TPA: ribosome-associated translation inhibitor RaiA [Bryobacteraceae bacterium]|nr:ribosome-associated translation inhibitor RaiA [Bryobacteraceae bacterium]